MLVCHSHPHIINSSVQTLWIWYTYIPNSLRGSKLLITKCGFVSQVAYYCIYAHAGASAPSNVVAVQEGPTGIRVFWIPPTPLGKTRGYRIYYSGGSSGSVDVSGGHIKNHVLTGLLSRANYTISIVGTSQHFPSDKVDYPYAIFLSKYCSLFHCILYNTPVCIP